MQDPVPGFLRFTARPTYGLILRIIGVCFLIVGLIAAGLDATWAGFTPTVWFLLALIFFLGVICNLLAQFLCRKHTGRHAPGEWHRVSEQAQEPAAPAEVPAAAPAASVVEPEAEKPAEAAFVEVEVYCVKCREKRMVRDPERVKLANGRPAYQGSCPVCGTKVIRILKAD